MTKLNMRLNQKDEDRINILKEKYGLTQTSELVRFLITSIATSVEKEDHIPFTPTVNDMPNGNFK